MGEEAVKPVKLKWSPQEAINGNDWSSASIGKYNLMASQYAPTKWMAKVWLNDDRIGFRNDQPSETAAQRTAESLTRELLKRESRRLETLQRKLA